MPLQIPLKRHLTCKPVSTTRLHLPSPRQPLRRRQHPVSAPVRQPDRRITRRVLKHIHRAAIEVRRGQSTAADGASEIAEAAEGTQRGVDGAAGHGAVGGLEEDVFFLCGVGGHGDGGAAADGDAFA